MQTTAQKVFYTVLNTVQFGGFEAELVQEQNLIFIRAVAWKGKQPRIALAPNQDGYADWLQLLTGAKGQRYTCSFYFVEGTADNLLDQWLAH